MIKCSLSIFDTLSQDQNTISKKWQTVLGSKSKFSTSEKVIRTTDSVSFLRGIEDLNKDLASDLTKQADVLVHLGNIADKLQSGNQVFINQNFSSLRV
jgi:hypothetical protein